MELFQLIRTAGPIVQTLAEFPWENMVRREMPDPMELLPEELKRHLENPQTSPDQTTAPIPTVRPPASPVPMEKPGCTAADESGVVLYHLQGLADGKPGFGVLATDLARLEHAAKGAEGMGDTTLAAELRAVSLIDVRDAEAASEAASRLKPLADQAWELGRKCGGGGPTPELVDKARELAEKVQSGELSREAAVKELRRA